MIVDRGVDGCELLQCSHPPEAAHRPLAPSEWLVRIFCTIVGPAAGFLKIDDAEVLEGRTIGAEAIRHHFLGVTVPLQRFLQEFQCGFLVARLRHKAFEPLALVVDGPPKIVLPTVDLHEDLVKVPVPTARPHPRNPAFSDFRSKKRPEPVPPKPHRLVADLNPALVQQVLDVAQRKRKPDVHHYRQADDLGRGFEIAKGAGFAHHARLGHRPASLKNFVLTLPDAEMLARMGSALDLQAQEPPHESLHDLKELLMARRGLIKDQTAAKTRLASVTVPLLQRQLKQRLTQIVRDIAQIDAGMSQQAGKDDAMAERMDILVSIPGVGKLTAITMLVDMPELGTLDARQVAALAGLAPITQRSGNWQGVARIQGGRPWIRRALYMPTLVAVRFNPDLKVKYTHSSSLPENGKRLPSPPASGKQSPRLFSDPQQRRKLLVMANTLLRAHRKWTEIRP